MSRTSLFLPAAALVAGLVGGILQDAASAPAVSAPVPSLAAATAMESPEPAVRVARPVVTRKTVVRRPAPPRPVAKPRPAHRAVARPAPVPAPRRRVVAVPVRVVAPPVPRPAPLPPAPAGPTKWAELNRAIARIPTYHGTGAKWVVASDDGYWGTVDWATSTIYIGPQVPVKRLYDVAVHEWSHVLQLKVYGGDQRLAKDAMNKYFGGTGLTGVERAADCMSRLQGAEWTNYTPCADARWRDGARRLLAGKRL